MHQCHKACFANNSITNHVLPTTLSRILQAKGVDAGAAAVRVSSLELGGLVGSLLAGRISDYMIEKSAGKGGNVGKRVQVCGWVGTRGGRVVFSTEREGNLHVLALALDYRAPTEHLTKALLIPTSLNYFLPLSHVGGYGVYGGHCSMSCSICSTARQRLVVAMGDGVYDWLFPVWPTNAHWPVWRRAGGSRECGRIRRLFGVGGIPGSSKCRDSLVHHCQGLRVECILYHLDWGCRHGAAAAVSHGEFEELRAARADQGEGSIGECSGVGYRK